mmetsp:Transcript_65612/g.137147  ORF Transcript_65612/g.137147 Transcript_65612/m.137147 type:complete len:203 (+) Transcript_65612:101-709(+)|eukprot:CAMPEP_0206465954 /NCGR_PEP_ID=MMETSP0324_2-20121206/28155_1 /ASSEMBLY_ACC=CAM_ASM_000836 /TAXON_ID=2866 /ORGANISM="Crypthecodinium cohnii, Strain Seligo" /LENGTH=202 /DNA_ID=CAMNT_0053938947 /DNA_START=97 /DNA_END=705 /DNA_ORIENTATION=-
MSKGSWLMGCAIFALCVAIAGIGPRNEVADFWNLITAPQAEGEQTLAREQVFCVILLGTFLLQDFVPLHKEQRIAQLVFGPNLFGLLVVILFLLFDTSVGLFDYLLSGEFKSRDPAKRESELLLSATNLVLVIAHIKSFRLRYCLHLMREQREDDRREVQDIRNLVEEVKSESEVERFTLLGRSKEDGLLRHIPSTDEKKLD